MTAVQFVRDVLALATPWDSRGSGVVVTLGVYLDKSGPNDAIKAVTVGGVIATTDGWIRFSEEWAEALHDFEDLPFFHMVDYDSGWGLYSEWKERGVKKERFERLLGIIERNVLGVVGASVSIADCAEYYPHPSPVETALSVATAHLINVIPQFRYLIERPDEDVLYTFESGDEGWGHLLNIYNRLSVGLDPGYSRFGGKLEVGRKKFPPLQAADIVAFEGWKQWARDYGGEQRGTRYPYRELNRRLPHQWATLRPMTQAELLISHGEHAAAAALSEETANEVQGVTAPLTRPSWG